MAILFTSTGSVPVNDKRATMARAARSKRDTAKKGGPAKANPPAAKCPICGEPAVKEYFPFSSKRCAEVDLNRWLSGRYAIPGAESEPEREVPTDEDEG
jgi:endogenous inhibitor of DNA gyrase (YacG/DUF329 family)